MENNMESNQPNEESFQERIDLSGVKATMEKIHTEVDKLLIGQEEMVELLLVSLIAGGHVLIEGNPGVAKTLTAKIIARTISSDFSRIQFTPDLMPSDVTGTSVFNFKTSDFEFRKGPIFSNIVLIDEINRSPAKTQAALFEVMEERQVTVDGYRYELDEPFMIVATQNPIEMEGTYRLPEAQMDRFIFKINVGYPNLEEEILILKSKHDSNNIIDLERINSVLSVEKLKNHRNLLPKIVVEDRLLRYIAEIVQRSRSYHDIAIGASPRASIALMMGSKALAIIRGRDYVTPDDIVDLVQPVLSHRITIIPEREMEGMGATDVINELIKSIEVPR
ncbi:MAG: MoxR family ATPase [Saprospiraceae bacterium]|nr:MoxR family ATPase [Saprospiraceae bacterium]